MEAHVILFQGFVAELLLQPFLQVTTCQTQHFRENSRNEKLVLSGLAGRFVTIQNDILKLFCILSSVNDISAQIHIRQNTHKVAADEQQWCSDIFSCLLHAVLRELPQMEMYTVKQLLKYTLKGSTLH